MIAALKCWVCRGKDCCLACKIASMGSALASISIDDKGLTLGCLCNIHKWQHLLKACTCIKLLVSSAS